MNKKSKNKKGKVLNPPQEVKLGDKLDLGVISDEGIAEKTSENVEETIESVKEERVPEIISAIMPPPVETKDEESPKKPRRNRGKKKKGKEDDAENKIYEEPKESEKKPALEQINDATILNDDPLDVPIVAPSIRKKINKKKNEEQKTEEPISSDFEQVPIPSTAITNEPDVQKETPLLPESVEQEVKSSKKKNKKKKRNDSETCEKEEISCTTAFQKLVGAQDKAIEIKIEDNVIPVKSTEPDSEILSKEDILITENILKKNTENVKEMSSVKGTEPQQLPVPESKGKKKNKKDKKLCSQNVENIFTSREDATNVISFSADNMAKDDFFKDTKKPEIEIDVDIEKPEIVVLQTSPKPKAKIAKPVEKKLKGHQYTQPEENTMQNVSLTKSMVSDEQLSRVELESVATKIYEPETLCHIRERTDQDLCQQEPVEISIPETTSNKTTEFNPQDFERLNILPETTGKKRKKGSKVPKTPDVSFEILDYQLDTDSKETDLETHPSNKEQTMVSDTGIIQKQEDSERNEAGKEQIIVDPPLESKVSMEQISQPLTLEHVLLTPEPLEERKRVQMDTLFFEKKDDTHKNETKSVKKRRKSPKGSQKDDPKATELLTQVPIQTDVAIPTLEVTKDVEEKVDASNITRIYDIEISSIKADESEGSACDSIPDVTYPRSISQELMDTNNNRTVIREMLPLQAISLETHKQETVKTQNIDVTVGSKETITTPKEEKTDIKSKMMEVNQDMEELRLSIERSLAELTAMEKNEEVTEKSCEESILRTEVKQEGQEQLESLLLPPVDNELSMILDKQQTTFEVIKSEPNKCIIESKNTGITAEESKKPTGPNTNIAISMATEQKPSENIATFDIITKINFKTQDLPTQKENVDEFSTATVPLTLQEENKAIQVGTENKSQNIDIKEQESKLDTPPVCPARKDPKNKNKKKKGKQDAQFGTHQPTQSAPGTTTSQTATTTQEVKKEEKADTKTEKSGSKGTKEKGKQQSSRSNTLTEQDLSSDVGFDPIENFEDALTSSVDDVNKTFEFIVKETQEQCNPKINITAPDEVKTPVSPPKNLLGHPDIPVSSNKRDYKKEKDKIPNEITASVNIKDAVDVERKQSKNTQTTNKLKDLKNCKLSDNKEFVYKYSFRKVFLQSSCHVCKKDLGGARMPCCYCNLVFYCGNKHKDEDWPVHQAFCFAVSTIGHLKDQKHIYGDIKNITGQDYRLIRMQMIVSCEKVLKRRLVPWEQESLLYPRLCAHVPCREWRQTNLSDCQGCGQVSFCKDNPDHCPKSHSRWCKSYSLYQKLVCYQQTKGRLEPRMPTKVMQEHYDIPEKINEVLAAMYEEKIDMNDIQYAALTQLATAPLTAAYCYQLYRKNNITTNGYKNSIFTIHVVGAELQFEADALNKWEVFFLHLRPDLQELRVVLINYNLNPSNLPLELLGKIQLCDQCRQDKRRVVMHFQDKWTYADYKSSEDFIIPDIVCAFNAGIQRSSVYNGKDPWPSTINVILKQKIPFIITSYTITELRKDCIRIKECSDIEFKIIAEPKLNSFASVRPDRNFITDDEMPLLFKNYCYVIICG